MIPRGCAAPLKAALHDTPVVLLHGARQTGKSTLAEQVAAGRYITLDDAPTLGAARADPSGFIAALDSPVVLDEVQRAPDLFLAIKRAVDRDRRPGRFLLTGSANILLLPMLSDSLAGRIEILTLWPMSQGELGGKPEHFVDALFAPKLPQPGKTKEPQLTAVRRILRGGFPEAAARTNDDRRTAWYASHLTTLLQRDVRDMSNIDGLNDLPRLLALLASRTAGLLNFSDISRSLEIPQTSLKRYITLLEAVFLVVRVPAWSTNLGLRLSKAPKVFLADTGLACHLVGASEDRILADSTLRGGLFENFVLMELTKQAGWSVIRPRIFHFRTHGGSEVDLVLEDRAGRIVGIEVKSGGSVTPNDFKGLRTLAAAAGKKFVRGIIIYDGPEQVAFDQDMVAVPLRALWSVA